MPTGCSWRSSPIQLFSIIVHYPPHLKLPHFLMSKEIILFQKTSDIDYVYAGIRCCGHGPCHFAIDCPLILLPIWKAEPGDLLCGENTDQRESDMEYASDIFSNKVARPARLLLQEYRVLKAAPKPIGYLMFTLPKTLPARTQNYPMRPNETQSCDSSPVC